MDQRGDEDLVKALMEEVRVVVAAAKQKGGGQAKVGGKRAQLAPAKKVRDIESGQEGAEGFEEACRSE